MIGSLKDQTLRLGTTSDRTEVEVLLSVMD